MVMIQLLPGKFFILQGIIFQGTISRYFIGINKVTTANNRKDYYSVEYFFQGGTVSSKISVCNFPA